MEKLGQNNIYSQYLGNKAILRTYKGTDLINEYVPLYTPPVDWSDIRTDCPENSIALYAAHSADYSSYDNLGFTATCTGGYNVFIDGEQYGSTYSSGSNCNITWSSLALDTGDDIITPSALKAHKIWIEPATAGNDITAFHCARVAASGTEQQGVLWSHFNIDNVINAALCLGRSNYYANAILEAITAKNNLLKVSDLNGFAYGATSLEYVPTIEGNNPSTVRVSSAFGGTGIKKVSLRNIKFASSSTYTFYNSKIEKINFKNVDTSGVSTFTSFFGQTFYIKSIPEMDYSGAEDMSSFIYYSKSLENTILDVRATKKLNRIGCYGSNTHFMDGFKGLRVSNEAPFDNATTPQISVNYTGMNRNALVQLFNDLPYNVGYEVVGSPTIDNGVVSGFSGSSYLQSGSTFPGSMATSLEFATKFNISSLASTSTIASSTTSEIPFHLAIRDSKFRLYPGRENVYKVGDFVLSENVDYYIKLFWDNTNGWKLQYSTDGINYTTDFENYNPSDSVPKDNYIVLGRNYVNGGQEGLLGSINLNNTYIKVNDVYWFRGQPAVTKTLSCVGCTGNQLSIVGSPTIVNGVVSGFSNVPNRSDVTTLDSLPSSSSLLIQVKFNTGTLKTNANQYILSTLSQTSRNICWGVASPSKKIRIYLSSNGTTWDIASAVDGTHILADNTDYIARLTFDGSKYVVSLLIDDQWVDDITITSSLPLSKQILRFGNNETGSSYWTGNIDLNETYIKVSDETWFDINNCLLPEDRAIATNKNWTLTLS